MRLPVQPDLRQLGIRDLLGTGGSSIGQEHDVVQGNCIGTQIDCASPAAQRHGRNPDRPPGQRRDHRRHGAGRRQRRSRSTSNGINMDDGVRNTIRGNSIFSNDGLGIDLGGDRRHAERSGRPRHRRQPPAELPDHHLRRAALTSGPQGASTRIRGFLRAAAATQLRPRLLLQRSRAPTGRRSSSRAARYLGSSTVTTDGAGLAAFDVTLPVDVAGGRSRVGDGHRSRSETPPSSPSGCRSSSSPRPGRRRAARTCRSRAPTSRPARRSRSAASRPATSSSTTPTPSARPRRCSRRAPSTT